MLLSDSSHVFIIQTIFDYSRKELESQDQRDADALSWIEERTKYILSFLTKVLDLFKLKDGKTGFDFKMQEFLGVLSSLELFKTRLLEWFCDKPDSDRLISLLSTDFYLKENCIVPLKDKDLSSLVSDWISFVFKDTKTKVQNLLNKIQSGVELARIRDGVLLITASFDLERKSENLGVLWSLYNSKILQKEISFWTDLYQGCFSDRFSSLMMLCFGTIFNNFSLSLDTVLHKMKDNDSTSTVFIY